MKSLKKGRAESGLERIKAAFVNRKAAMLLAVLIAAGFGVFKMSEQPDAPALPPIVEKNIQESAVHEAKVDGEMAVEELEKEISDLGQGFGEKIESLKRDLRIAQTMHGSKSWDKAFDAFKGVSSACAALRAREEVRGQASDVRDQMERKRRDAEAQSAESLAKKEWENGVGAARVAAQAFGNGKFEEASKGWKKAAKMFQTSEEMATAISLYRKAKGEWEGRMSNIEQGVSNSEVEKYASEEWTAAERSARLGAEMESNPVRGKAHYVAALSSFKKAVAKTIPFLQKGPENGKKWTAELGGGVEMEFMPIAAGSFQMGSNDGRDREKPVHRGTIGKPFWIAKNEVTNEEYQQFLRESGYNGEGDADNDYLRHHKGWNQYASTEKKYPIVAVSWKNAEAFCKWLTRKERKEGRLPEGVEYTLPTEAQWEYACRAGTTGKHAGDLDEMAWYSENSGRKMHPVGTKKANAWGLHDMHGNVWEWCLDDWHDSYNGAPANGSRWGDGSGSYRVLRGGCWDDDAEGCRSANRRRGNPSDANYNLGFRVCLVRK